MRRPSRSTIPRSGSTRSIPFWWTVLISPAVASSSADTSRSGSATGGRHESCARATIPRRAGLSAMSGADATAGGQQSVAAPSPYRLREAAAATIALISSHNRRRDPESSSINRVRRRALSVSVTSVPALKSRHSDAAPADSPRPPPLMPPLVKAVLDDVERLISTDSQRQSHTYEWSGFCCGVQ